MSIIGRIRDRHAAATADEEWLTAAPPTPSTPPMEPTGSRLDGGIAAEQAAGGLGAPLTAGRAAAVRFQVAKPGYAFDQVETFVRQAQESLAALEEGLYHRDVELSAAREDVQALEEKSATLQATIEVFRANGDPETTHEGDYITEEQWERMQAERDQAIQHVHQLTEEITQLRAQIDSMSASVVESTQDTDHPEASIDPAELLAAQEQVNELQEALRQAEQENSQLRHERDATESTSTDDSEHLAEELRKVTTERDEAIQEVEDLRHYIDNELPEWAANVTAAAKAAADAPPAEGGGATETPQTPPSTLHNAPELS